MNKDIKTKFYAILIAAALAATISFIAELLKGLSGLTAPDLTSYLIKTSVAAAYLIKTSTLG